MKNLLGIFLVIFITNVSLGQNVDLENNELIRWKDSSGTWRSQISTNGNIFQVTAMGSGQHLYFGDGTNGTSDTWFNTASGIAPSTVPLIIKSSGNIGIGTNTPANKFVVKSLDNDDNIIVLGLQPSINDNTQGGLGVAAGGVISLNAYNNLTFQTDGGNGYSEHMRINSEGKVGIGTTNFSGDHKLRVEGSIGAREIKVEGTGWSDFVFENDYELKTLDEVEKYISKSGHLPEIPSEADVIENGINLGEMNAKLLQKIEELTLYLIEQNKNLEQANSNIKELQREVSALKNK